MERTPKLPPLPEPLTPANRIEGTRTIDQMRAYALAAVSERDALLRRAVEALEAFNQTTITLSGVVIGLTTDDFKRASTTAKALRAHLEQ